MALLRDFAGLAAIFLSLTVFYACAWAAPTSDDEGSSVAAVALSSDNSEPGQHNKNAPTPSESRTDRVRRAAIKEWDLPERGRERRDYEEEDGSPWNERRERRGSSKHLVDRRSGDHWGDYDSLERGRERRRSLSVNHELASLADMLQDSSKQRKLNKLKTLREEYGKRSANYHAGSEDDEADRW